MTKPQLVDGRYGRRAILKSAWSENIAEFILANEVVELELNSAKGWRDSDLVFLNALPNLLSLDIIDLRLESVDPIHSLHQLKSLKVFTYCNTEIRFSNFPLLERCALEWRPKATSVFDCHTLNDLFINRYKGRDLDSLANLENLKSLGILNSPTSNLLGLRNLHNLESLRLANLRKVTSLSGLEMLENLVDLNIQRCRSITSIEEIGRLKRLKSLALSDCGDIESFQPLAGLKNLKMLIFDESTNVLDGDLTPLIQTLTLSQIAFRNRRHYSHRREEFSGYR